jgi:hypothetical protein
MWLRLWSSLFEVENAGTVGKEIRNYQKGA